MVSYKSKIETWVKSNKDNLPLLEAIQMWYWNPSSWRIRKNQEIFFKEATKNLQLRYNTDETRIALLEFESTMKSFSHLQLRNLEKAIEDAIISHVVETLWDRVEKEVQERDWLGPAMIILADYLDLEGLWNEDKGLTSAHKKSIEKQLTYSNLTSSVRFKDFVKVGLFYEMTWQKTTGEKQKRYTQPYGWENTEILEILFAAKKKAHIHHPKGSAKLSGITSVVGSGALHLIPYDSFEIGREALSTALMKSSGFLNVQDNYLNRSTLQLIDRNVPIDVSIQILTEIADWKIKKNRTREIRRWIAIAEEFEDIQKRRPHFYIRSNKSNFLHDRILYSETYTCALTTSIKDVGGSKTSLIIYLDESIGDELDREFKSIWNDSGTYEITPSNIHKTISKINRSPND